MQFGRAVRKEEFKRFLLFFFYNAADNFNWNSFVKARKVPQNNWKQSLWGEKVSLRVLVYPKMRRSFRWRVELCEKKLCFWKKTKRNCRIDANCGRCVIAGLHRPFFWETFLISRGSSCKKIFYYFSDFLFTII